MMYDYQKGKEKEKIHEHLSSPIFERPNVARSMIVQLDASP